MKVIGDEGVSPKCWCSSGTISRVDTSGCYAYWRSVFLTNLRDILHQDFSSSSHFEPGSDLSWGLSCALWDVERHPWSLPVDVSTSPAHMVTTNSIFGHCHISLGSGQGLGGGGGKSCWWRTTALHWRSSFVSRITDPQQHRTLHITEPGYVPGWSLKLGLHLLSACTVHYRRKRSRCHI